MTNAEILDDLLVRFEAGEIADDYQPTAEEATAMRWLIREIAAVGAALTEVFRAAYANMVGAINAVAEAWPAMTVWTEHDEIERPVASEAGGWTTWHPSLHESVDMLPYDDDPAGCWADVWSEKHAVYLECAAPADPTSPLGLCAEHEATMRRLDG